MTILLKNEKGYVATLKVYGNRVEYEISTYDSHGAIDWSSDKKAVEANAIANVMVKLGWLLKGLLIEGFELIDII